jgi:hypothetical protein
MVGDLLGLLVLAHLWEGQQKESTTNEFKSTTGKEGGAKSSEQHTRKHKSNLAMFRAPCSSAQP